MLLQRFYPSAKPNIFLWWRECFVGIYLLLTLIIGGFAPRLFQGPNDFLFFEIFIKDIFLIVVVLGMLWFIQQAKPQPGALRELTFLNSLPLLNSQIALHFLCVEIYRILWLPMSLITVLFTLLPYAPSAHIWRVGFFLLLLYILTVFANVLMQYIIKSKIYHPLAQQHPMPIFFTIMLFIIGCLVLVFFETLVSGIAFWLLFFIFADVLLASLFLYIHLFTIQQRANFAYWTIGKSAERRNNAARTIFIKWPQVISPLLVKNVRKFTREKSPSAMILTVIFIVGGYLVSRNNERLDDFIAILHAALLLYAIVFSIKAQYMFAVENESPTFLYSLPVRTSELLLATAIPPAAWLLMITFVFCLLASIAHVRLEDVLLFWLRSASVSLGFLVVALNTACARYPDLKAAQKQFSLWGLLLLILFALFYRFRYVIFFILVAASFVRLFGVKFYKMSS